MMRKKNKKDKKAKAEDVETPEEQVDQTAADTESKEDEKQKEQTPEEQIAELKDRLQRTTAEFVNFRKQTEKRQRDSRLFVRKDVFEQLLPIVDNFGAAMQALDLGQDADNVIVGVKMIHGMFENLLTDNGIKPMNAKGENFDPSLHEAVSQEVTEDEEPNKILKEIAKGYTMGDMVLRPARVVVSALPAEEVEEPAEEPSAKEEDGDKE